MHSLYNQNTRNILITKALVGLIFAYCLAFNTAVAQSEQQRGEARNRVEPEGFLYGIGIALKGEIYQGFDQREIVIPFIGYRGERFQFYGPFVRYNFFENNGLKVSARIRPVFAGYSESDSDVFQGMDERESTLYLGLGLNYEKDNWKFELTGGQDALNRSDGSVLIASIGKLFRQGSIFVEPAIGINYFDQKHVDYYYGVASSETTTSRAAFDGDEAVNTQLSLSFITPMFFEGLTRLSFENTWFDSSITDSPLTDDDTSLTLFFSFSKFF